MVCQSIQNYQYQNVIFLLIKAILGKYCIKNNLQNDFILLFSDDAGFWSENDEAVAIGKFY